MKTKNLILALTALLLAVGSVYATLAPVAPRVKVRFCWDIFTSCLTLGGSCEDTGSVACRITVNGIDYQAFNAGCVAPLKNNTNAAVATLASKDICTIYNTPL